MISAVLFLIYILGIGGACCVVVSLFSFAIGLVEKDRRKISFGGKILLWGIGILFVWVVIVISILSRMHC
jgi:hypothetical protein